MRDTVPKKKREPVDVLKRVFRIHSHNKKGGVLSRTLNRLIYMAVALVFALVLATVFYSSLWRMHDSGLIVSGVMEGTFTIMMSLTFAIIGVYLVVHVLHPHFGKRPVPKSLEKVIEECNVSDDMTRDDLICVIKEAEADEEIKAYLDTLGVKTDIAVTLFIALVAFFLGMYGYLAAFTVELDQTPDILGISFCFMFTIFSGVYMILKTMKVVWDV